MCFKQERTISHVNAAGRSSNTERKKQAAIRFSNRQTTATLTRLLFVEWCRKNLAGRGVTTERIHRFIAVSLYGGDIGRSGR